jgi:hypothetical protein
VIGALTGHSLYVTRFFRGDRRLLMLALPVAVGMILLKWLYDESALKHLDFSPLLTGVIAAEVFIIGFILSGTTADFKEAERLPGELVASLETIADECLIMDAELQIPEARECLSLLAEIGASVRLWLLHDTDLDGVIAKLRQLNPFFMVFAPKIQAGFTTRLKSEQANIRKLVIRMDTMRRTSYVSAALSHRGGHRVDDPRPADDHRDRSARAHDPGRRCDHLLDGLHVGVDSRHRQPVRVSRRAARTGRRGSHCDRAK